MRSHVLLHCALVIGRVVAVDPLVALNYTTYRGTALSNGITQWRGMRYAASPTGDLRWAVPEDPPTSSQTLDADEDGRLCLITPGTNSPPGPKHSEDCLFLSVYAPSSATSSSKLPVYFFIQGGGFAVDGNANYNGSGLIAASNMNIVVVNFNYRVGLYGFLASEELLAEGGVNFGLHDQRKALEWVQKYISQFGGDPGHVVMGGDSAGATSITLHLTAYGGRNDNLFHATAAESQSFAAVRTVNQCQYQYDNLVNRTGCTGETNTLACLRSINDTDLQSVNTNIPYPGAVGPPLYMYNPVIDAGLVYERTYASFAKGNFLRLPAIYGDDTNEGTLFAPKDTDTVADMDAFLNDEFPGLTTKSLAKINDIYPAAQQYPDSGQYWRAASNAYGEMRYICPGIYLSQRYAEQRVSGNWNYHWNVNDSVTNESGLGVAHTTEVYAIWGPDNVDSEGPHSLNSTNANIIPVVQAYWTSFIRDFNPNTYRLAGSPMWEEWTVGDGGFMAQKPNGRVGSSVQLGGAGGQRLLLETNSTQMETVPTDQRKRCEYLVGVALGLDQ